ncbi:Gfo/Idh/MocA family protein [Candidatus Omnitrophota bacterium]
MYNVALIGAGKIGLLYDAQQSRKTALSHAKGIYLHKNFKLKYLVDKNKQLFPKARKLFPKLQCFRDWQPLINNRDIDILAIALPTQLHFDCLNDFAPNKRIKLFFVEKPLFAAGAEYQGIDPGVKKKIVVNYIRRFDPVIIALKDKIKKGVYRRPLKIIAKYSKGFQHNASHAVDLVNYLFGNPKVIESMVLDKKNDGIKDDPALDVFARVKSQGATFPVYFIAGEEKKYSIFELDILFENKRIELVDLARTIKTYDLVADPEYAGYKILGVDAEVQNTDMRFVMRNAYSILGSIINKRMKNISSFQDEMHNSNFINSVQNELNYV